SDDRTCVPSGGPCTINGDCCPGTQCIRLPGSTQGECGIPETPGSDGSGGMTGSAGAAATGGSAGGGGTIGGTPGSAGAAVAGGSAGGGGTTGAGGSITLCSEFGQMCGEEVECCSAIPCTEGICYFPL
ncbi:hypothetical protein ACFL5O_09080, partial [Myxococcota bacterium]